MKENIKNFTYKNLEIKIVELNLKRFRAEQIFRQIHKNFISDFDKLKNIPKSSIEILKNNFYISDLNLLKTSSSEKDNTKKFLFQTTDINKSAENIESVLIREETRETFCISTQAGCNVGCEFCATGKMNLLRNLSSGEIVSQVYDIIKATNIIPTNIVYMGMGEPFLNYSNLIDSLLILTDEKGLNIPARRITVSTVGFKGKIKKFADDIINENSLKNVKLALSLHTTDVGLRESIIPTSNKNKL